jgi:hypothetical protein
MEKKAENIPKQNEIVFHDRTTIAPNPFKKMDYDRDSIMRELERG